MYKKSSVKQLSQSYYQEWELGKGGLDPGVIISNKLIYLASLQFVSHFYIVKLQIIISKLLNCNFRYLDKKIKR